MKLILLVGVLLLYFPALYYLKRRIMKESGGIEVPEHLQWYESSLYIIKTTPDESKKATLARLHRQIRGISMAGIILFWFIILFIPL